MESTAPIEQRAEVSLNTNVQALRWSGPNGSEHILSIFCSLRCCRRFWTAGSGSASHLARRGSPGGLQKEGTGFKSFSPIRPAVNPLWGDVRRKEEVRSLSRGADALFHCAGPFRLQPLLPLEVALEERLHYADLGDDVEYLQKTYETISASPLSDRLVIPGASSLPSMTSLLTRIAELKHGKVQKIRIHVFIGNRNPKGKSAIDYLIRALRKPFQARRNGEWTPQTTWSEHIRYESRFSSGLLPFNLIESPDDLFLPKWFQATDTAFYVSLEFSWIHRVIGAIGLSQRFLPSSFDPLWVRFLFHGHPWMHQMGTRRGWLEIVTTHSSGASAVTFTQQPEGTDEGQRVPTFPMALIARYLAAAGREAPRRTTRFFDLLSTDHFLEEIASEKIIYRETMLRNNGAPM